MFGAQNIYVSVGNDQLTTHVNRGNASRVNIGLGVVPA